MTPTAETLADLLSWMVSVPVLVFAAWVLDQFTRGRVPLWALLITFVAVVGVLGMLLRPLTTMGVLDDAGRTNLAIVVRTVALILAVGLVWHLIDIAVDRWRDHGRNG